MINILNIISLILSLICVILTAYIFKNADSDEDKLYKLKLLLLIVWIIIFIITCINLIK